MSFNRRFAGTVKGDGHKTAVSRYTNEPIVGHIRGWDFGVMVRGIPGANEDAFEIILTGGSNRPSTQYSLGWYTLRDLQDGDITIKRNKSAD